MTTAKLMQELFINLENLSDVDIITEYGIEYLEFKIDTQNKIKNIRLSRLYVPVGKYSYIGVN
tara:strand:+ start:255 stop:443 length:189 start_codon:yes stop_codon:yes gene_type:complete